MSQSWIGVVALFLVLCAYSLYYNLYNGTLDPYNVLVQGPRAIDTTPHKLEVCAALRDRLLNVHKIGFVPSDSPLHKYWDDLNCLAMNLPPVGATSTIPIQQSYHGDTTNKNSVHIKASNSKEKKREFSLNGIDEVEVDSAEAKTMCQHMKNSFNVEPGLSWGWLSDTLQAQWKRLNCDASPDDDDYTGPEEVTPRAAAGIKKETVQKQIDDGHKDRISHTPKALVGKTCRELKIKYDVVPGRSWGSMEEDMQIEWSSLKCDQFFSVAMLQTEEFQISSEANEKNNKKRGKKEGYSDSDWCVEMKKTYKVIPMQSWGHLPQNMISTWKDKHCDVVFTKLRLSNTKISTCDAPKKGTKLPLIAIMAGTTSRKMKDPNIKMMSLFTYLLPSLIRSLDCGFDYLFVLGYDKGDKFYDNEKGMNNVNEWFDKKVKTVLKEHGIHIKLLPVKVNNSIKKPGPVFIGMARAAYDAGADYFYRINDDTEIAGHWPKVFVNALQSLPPPFGVVGPTCKQGNQGILTHDFVHRTHMDIFEMNYYPPELVDWWMDDWISVVYGYKRTFEAKQSPVVHHTGAHGQRYEVDRANFKNLARLVEEGRQRIKMWMLKHNVSASALLAFEKDNFNFKRRQKAPTIDEF